MDSSEIAKIVHFHRKRSGLSQAELAKFASLGKTVIFDIEKGKSTVKLSTLLKVLKILNIQIELESPLMQLYKEGLNEKS